MNGRERNLGALLWSFEISFKVSQSRRPSSISGMRFYCLLIGVFGIRPTDYSLALIVLRSLTEHRA